MNVNLNTVGEIKLGEPSQVAESKLPKRIVTSNHNTSTNVEAVINTEKWCEKPGRLVESQKKFETEIHDIKRKSKKNIIDAEKEVKYNKIVENKDGSRFIEFELWDKTYKFSYTSEEYPLWSMVWDNVEQWGDEDLKQYVKDEELKWVHMKNRGIMENRLQELWNYAGLDESSDQIAMLMYLTGASWPYAIGMRNQNARSVIRCFGENRRIMDYNCQELNKAKYKILMFD